MTRAEALREIENHKAFLAECAANPQVPTAEIAAKYGLAMGNVFPEGR